VKPGLVFILFEKIVECVLFRMNAKGLCKFVVSSVVSACHNLVAMQNDCSVFYFHGRFVCDSSAHFQNSQLLLLVHSNVASVKK
jgi:hypothetical protein